MLLGLAFASILVVMPVNAQAPITTPGMFDQAFREGHKGSVSELYGRMLRGKNASDFVTLSNDSNRKIIFLLDSQGLEKLLGLSGYQVLEEIGYTGDYIQELVATEHQFKLCVFSSSGASPANWDQVVELLTQMDPSVAKVVQSQLKGLRETSFEAIEALGTEPFPATRSRGRDDPAFMTGARLLESPGSLQDVRLYLYLELHLTELYTGTGFTKRPDGTQGPPEFIAPNVPLSALGDHRLIPVEVNVPAKNPH